MWQNTVLANGMVWGLVIQCGSETRMAMNGREPQYKYGLLDEEVNHAAILLFLMMATLSAFVTGVSGVPLNTNDICI
jgi:magnesium-transporting ATPase (P-type)